ncbi:MAG: hypothetical protein QOI58_1734 [Thermoanaerobaculia bacterium]|nr:hypothetical protein [Thermoanaerobaculia bacterium]
MRRASLAFAVLAFASFARAESLRVVAPANGATLRGGSFAELRWTSAQLPPKAEEWEAFLSVDGGKYYAFRVTPHLDIQLRSFTFVVPNVDTRNARILIRTGDEVHELHFESRDSFSIVRDAKAEQPLPRLSQSGRGEAAREGDPAVLAWTDGERNGSGATRQSSAPASSAALTPSIADSHGDVPVLVPSANVFAAPASTPTSLLPARISHVRASTPLGTSVDLLLVCSRWNI